VTIATVRDRVAALRSVPEARNAVVVAGIALASMVSAFFVGRGQWYLALALFLVLPAVLVFHRNPLLALAVWLAVDPFLQVVSVPGARRLFWVFHRGLPVLILGLIVVARFSGLTRRRLTFGLLEIIMGGYLIVSILSIQYASPTVLATTYLLYDRIAIPMAVYLLVRWYPPGWRSLQAVVPVMAFLLFSQLIIGALQWFAPDLLPGAWLSRAGSRTTGSLSHPNVYGTTVLMAGAFLMHMGRTMERPRVPRWAYSAAFGASIMAAFLTFSRASWLAALVAFGVMFVMHRRAVMRMAGAFAGLALIVVLATPVEPLVENLSTRFYSDQSQQSALSRLPVVLASLRMFEAKPVAGWGYGNFDLYDRQFQGRVGDLFVPDKDHASHNLYLTILAEQGLIGILLYLGPAVLLLIKTPGAVRRLSRDGPTGRGLLVVAWLVPMMHLVVNNFSNMRVPFGLGIYWLSLAIIAGLVMPPRTRSAEPEVVRILQPAWDRE
jgi:O-antigen ligase